MRRSIGMVWFLPFLFFFVFHSGSFLIMGILLVVFLNIIMASVGGMSRTNTTRIQPMADPEPMVSPKQYQPYEEQLYESYQGGYQPQPEPYRAPVQSYQSPRQPEYEEPQIQYPTEQELPPMEQ